MTKGAALEAGSKSWTRASLQERSQLSSAWRESKWLDAAFGSMLVKLLGLLQLRLEALDLLLDQVLGQLGDDFPRDLPDHLLGDLGHHALGDLRHHVHRHAL